MQHLCIPDKTAPLFPCRLPAEGDPCDIHKCEEFRLAYDEYDTIAKQSNEPRSSFGVHGQIRSPLGLPDRALVAAISTSQNGISSCRRVPLRHGPLARGASAGPADLSSEWARAVRHARRQERMGSGAAIGRLCVGRARRPGRRSERGPGAPPRSLGIVAAGPWATAQAPGARGGRIGAGREARPRYGPALD